MGKFAAEAGHGVILSSYVIEHHIGSADLAHNAAIDCAGRAARGDRGRRATWASCSPCLCRWRCWLCAVTPAWWPVLPLTLLVRGLAAWTVSVRVLRATLTWLLIPIEDIAAFFFWIAGFFGNTITWRGQRYRLYSGRALRAGRLKSARNSPSRSQESSTKGRRVAASPT